MSNGYKKICNILAASNVSEREIYDFLSTIHNISEHEILDHIMDVRKMLATEFGNFNHSSKYWNNAPSFEIPSETENKIVHLLLEEADLPKTLAVSLMTEELEKRFPFSIPSESRKGFSNWIRKLLSTIPESELLHIATRIRNEYVHDQKYDWRLK